MKKVRHEHVKPTEDLVAKKIFSNTEITSAFISDILGLSVKCSKILDGTQIHSSFEDEVLLYNTSLDVLAELDDGTQVIIEIQVAKQLEFLKRLWVCICNQVSKNMDTIRLQLGRTSPIYSELIPVYSVSILEKNYFDDDRAIRSFSLRDDDTNKQLKVDVKGIQEKRNLITMAFLELSKYNPDIRENYNKKRWLELFSNQPFTQSQDEIIESADSLMEYKNWSEEEKAMYDEKTRKYDAYIDALQYKFVEGIAQGRSEGLEQGRNEGIEQGIEQGIEKGRSEERKNSIAKFIKYVKLGVISKKDACQDLGLTEKELDKYLQA
ncbi:Rpn family recombination-promoting nuclease/putative transposase [uncultured Gemella sp.]|uniref:Rpn family recombination-promoting nuclease/putative transposase n=1 Tax=uncultured Gemella sp. TaxID=254352 RepID=UPI0028E9F3D6|nr:Rpn family recombination-promoting nuclease/putative transposase [uncultured Gemella sp.]